MSLIAQLADAVASELNGAPAGTFSQAFTASRAVLPVRQLSELAALHVTVVPRSLQAQLSTRAMSFFDVEIDIGIQKKLGRDLDAEIDPLLDLVEEIVAYLRGRQLKSAPGTAWLGTKNEPIYAADHLSEQRVFTSVVTLTYRAAR